MDLTVELDGKILNVRAAGVIIHNNKVLMHRNINHDHYALIGGRVMVGENSIDTIKSSLKQAKLSDKEKYDAIKRLNKFIN